MPGGVVTNPGIDVLVEYALDGTSFTPIPYAGSFATSGGEPEVIEGDTFDGPFKVTSGIRVPDADIAFPTMVPNHSSWVDLFGAAAGSNPSITYRISIPERQFYVASGVGNTVAISTGGAVTFVGTAPDFTSKRFGRGMVIKGSTGAGAFALVIDTISNTGVVTVKPAPTQAVPAKPGYSIVAPRLTKTFTATLRSPIHDNIETGAVLNSTLQLSLNEPLPTWRMEA